MFLAGRTPALTLQIEELPTLLLELERAGYVEHIGPRIKRAGELVAFVRLVSKDRQIHVQVLRSECGKAINVYAHTEPAGWGLAHLWAALTDRVSYQHGSRIVREDVGAAFGEQAA